MINGLLWLYKLLGQQTILAVAAITILTRLLILPLTLRQQRSAQKMQELQAGPEWQKIQKKYAKDREKLAQEQMRLYREAGANPMSGCLPLLIQFPIMIGLYQAIIRGLATSPVELFDLSQHIYRWAPGLTDLIPLQSTFLWLDLGQPDPYYILPILVVATTWLSQRLLTPPTPAGGASSQTTAMNQQMQIMMPLMFGFFALSFASGLSIYFILSNLVSMLQYFLTSGRGLSLPTKGKGDQARRRRSAGSRKE